MFIFLAKVSFCVFQLAMESSLREQVHDLINEYSDNVKKYFLALSAVAESNTVDKSRDTKQIIKQMALIDKKLQQAVELSKNNRMITFKVKF